MMRYKTALIGFGRMAAGYAADPANARWFSYATHAQVLREHPAFDWVAVVDPSHEARRSASAYWGGVITAPSLAELPNADLIEIAVIATPPEARSGILDCLPSLRAVLVEKPLGVDVGEAAAFVDECRRRGLVGAVNFPRSFEPELINLARGGLQKAIGRPQAVFGTYGNGLRNNGGHLVSLVNMLLGPAKQVYPMAGARRFIEGPIEGDCNLPFAMILNDGLAAAIQPLSFASYREVGLDIWGEAGRIQILNESLTLLTTPVADNRQLTGSRELCHESTSTRYSELGRALYLAYDNLIAALHGDEELRCSLDDALVTMRLVESLMEQVN